MTTYLYCRISRATQNIERQIRNLTRLYPDGVIIQEAYTGTKINRKEWNKLMKLVKAGDKIVFDSVSRMSRNEVEGFETYEELYKQGIELEFLNEPHINTETFKKAIDKAVPMTGTAVDFILEGINRYLMELAKEQIRLAFQQAQKEVDDLHTRTSQGMETARINGKQIGQKVGASWETKKSVEAKKVIRKHAVDFGGNLSDGEVMKLTGLSRNTFYKYKRELKEEKI